MSVSTYSVAIPSPVNQDLVQHLLRADGQEDLCFALWYPSRGTTRTTALIYESLLPLNGERTVHGNASFLPRYFERAIGTAVEKGAGLAFLHSHPAPGWQGMSDDDIRAEQGHAAAALGATGLPLVGLTLGTDGAWSARFWERLAPRTYERQWCSHVRVVGEQLAVTYMDKLVPPPRFKEELQRTVSAWGEDVQSRLARLQIGIVGLGSVGSIIAEALARTGIQSVVLIDFDIVERVNLDRILHATRRDAILQRFKVETIARAIWESATADGFKVLPVACSVAEEEGFRAALDCDVLFCCVDRPLGRSVLNFIANAHVIPVIDGGIAVENSPQVGLKKADWRAHVAAPGRRCLECLEQYDPSLVAADREGYFDDPTYIAGLPKNHALRRNENVFAFGLSAASFEILQMLMMVVAPLGIHDAGVQTYHFVPGSLDVIDPRSCRENCLYPTLTAKGDRAGVCVTGRHKKAEEIRGAREAAYRARSWKHKLVDVIEAGADWAATKLLRM